MSNISFYIKQSNRSYNSEINNHVKCDGWMDDAWMDIDGQTHANRQTDTQTDGWINRSIFHSLLKHLDGWNDGWMMDGWKTHVLNEQNAGKKS